METSWDGTMREEASLRVGEGKGGQERDSEEEVHQVD